MARWIDVVIREVPTPLPGGAHNLKYSICLHRRRNRENAKRQFHDGDGRYEEVGGIDT